MPIRILVLVPRPHVKPFLRETFFHEMLLHDVSRKFFVTNVFSYTVHSFLLVDAEKSLMGYANLLCLTVGVTAVVDESRVVSLLSGIQDLRQGEHH